MLRLRTKFARVYALQESTEIEEALRLAGEGLAEAQAVGYAPSIAEAHFRIGSLHSQTGEHDEAIDALERAYYIALEAKFDALAAQSAKSLVFIATDGKPDLDAAERWLDAEASALQRLPPDHEQQPWLFESLALVAYAKGHHAEALSARRDAVARISEVFGPDSDEAGRMLSNYAIDLADAGDMEEARAALLRALEIRIAVHGTAHPETAKLYINMCTLELHEANNAVAEVYCRRASEVFDATFGRDHYHSALAAAMLGNVLKAERTDSTRRSRSCAMPSSASRGRWDLHTRTLR